MARKMLIDGEAELGKAAEEGTNFDFDLFIIGAGSGGLRAARFSANFGAKVGICELPFHPISSETVGGVGGTSEPIDRVQKIKFMEKTGICWKKT